MWKHCSSLRSGTKLTQKTPWGMSENESAISKILFVLKESRLKKMTCQRTSDLKIGSSNKFQALPKNWDWKSSVIEEISTDEFYLRTFKVSQEFILVDVSQICFSRECIFHQKSFLVRIGWVPNKRRETFFTDAASGDAFFRCC